MNGVGFVVALDCEAKPLLARYRLRRDRDARGFSVYRAERPAATLIVCGVGQTAAAAATAYLAAAGRRGPAFWINVGVAGHARYAIGDVYLAHRIEDDDGRCWYPPLVIRPPCPSAALRSVGRPQVDYPDEAVYDMEAAGFFAIASRFVSAELIQSVKIISDNRDSPASRLDAGTIAALIAARLDQLDDIVSQTCELAGELAAAEGDDDEYRYFLDRFRFSESERYQLRDLLRRRQTLYPEAPMPLADVADGRQLLRRLRLDTALGTTTRAGSR